MHAFNSFQIRAGVSDAGYVGDPFTWTNNRKGKARIWERIDRVLINGLALAAFPDIRVSHLDRVHSDHRPLLVEPAGHKANFGFFHYIPAWENHPCFRSAVEENWRGSMNNNPMVNFGLKLRRLRVFLRKWNWEVFGNIKAKLRDIQLRINHLEGLIQQDWNADQARSLEACNLEYQDLNNTQLDILSSKAKLLWFQDGDRNSKFYHAAIKARRSTNKISLRMDDDTFTDDRDIIGAKAVEFYTNLFSGYSPPPSIDNFSIIDPIVTDSDNNALCSYPDFDEIFEVISDMKDNSAPGPDGFTGRFYIYCWDIIKDDLLAAVRGFFSGLQLPTSFTATFLTLIPKVNNATSMSQMRPISLCNFCHKILSRIIMKRLTNWLPMLVSEEQAGFVKGRSIHDNIALVHDLTHDLNTKTVGGNLIIKLDIAKAYDRVSWVFILRMLQAFGFSHKWQDLIFRCIANCRYSVKWDGKSYGYFRSHRGLRQGDPLSSGIFVLVMEWFSRVLNNAVSERFILPYYTKRQAQVVTHLLFADDLIIFTNGAKDSLRNLKILLSDFCDFSGQSLNNNKSIIIFSKKISHSRKQDILELTGFSEGFLPITYLGTPMFRGRTRVDMFEYLEQKILKRIQGWSRNFLSMGGKITLVNAVLNSVSIHSMLVLPIPTTVLDRIISHIANFIWSNGSDNRHHWVGWGKVCYPKEAGGLGILDPKSMMLAFHGKLAWNYIANNSLWARYAHSRFKEGRKGSPLWNKFSHLIQVIREDSRWSIGKGDTLVSTFCDKLDVKAPRDLMHKTIREVLADSPSRTAITNILPACRRDDLESIQFSDLPDRFVWKFSSDGAFNIKKFRLSFQTNHINVPWGKSIWRKWIPMKIGVFIWRLFRNAISTDDNVNKLGIYLPSRCVCCASHKSESISHLFFDSDIGKELWHHLSTLFDRPRVHGLAAVNRIWLKSQTYLDCLAAGMVCCGLWEIWKSRNSLVFEQKRRDWKRALLSWPPLIIKSIDRYYHRSMQSDLILQSLGINSTILRAGSKVWRPGEGGNTANIAMLNLGYSVKGAAVLRNSDGFFLKALVKVVPISQLHIDLAWFLKQVVTICLAHNIHVANIFGCHSLFYSLQNRNVDMFAGFNGIVDMNAIAFRRVCPMENGAAIAVASTCNPGVYDEASLLHVAAQNALALDSKASFHLCAPSCKHRARIPSQTRDDSSLINQTYHCQPFLDDSVVY